MKVAVVFVILLTAGFAAIAADAATNASDAAQLEALYQRFLKEMREGQSKFPTNFDTSFMTNFDTPFFREYFKHTMIVHPSFGIRWDEVPPPTMLGAEGMKSVNAFVKTNGWNMYTNGMGFVMEMNPAKTIRGLPWTAIHDETFRALTDSGILYVLFGEFGVNCHGVAYNPQTNSFGNININFKHLGQHWYAWMVADDGAILRQEYEGKKH